MKIPLNILLPDELLVRVSMYLDLPAILAFRAASTCLANLTPIMLEHDPKTRALFAIATDGHPDFGLDADGIAELLYDVHTVSPPMALHLINLIGLAGPGWVMGVIADNGSAKGYAQEMYAAMLNFGALEDDRLESMRISVATQFAELAVASTGACWIRAATECAGQRSGLVDAGFGLYAQGSVAFSVIFATPQLY
ncbi:hypothetical protein BC828DRAFT_382668 [Blastocladiella britannica]|nr:hypothetical protein BC828DRAFT_382668 [Blastocladiella britannica]